MMQQAEDCTYPPCLSLDAEVIPQDGAKPSYIAVASSVGRYLSLGAIEHRVLELLDGTRTPSQIEFEFIRSGTAIGSADFTRFLSKLDEVGLLAGERSGNSQRANQAGQEYYWRLSFFNPDAFFARMAARLRWKSRRLFCPNGGTATLDMDSGFFCAQHSSDALRQRFCCAGLVKFPASGLGCHPAQLLCHIPSCLGRYGLA
jgi:hypothetical protein